MSDPITRAAAALSSRRSFSRCRSLVTLDDHGGLMSMHQLATACGWDAYRLRSVLFGDEGDDKTFSVERSPFALGQIRVFGTPHGEFVMLTEQGVEEVQQLRLEPHWARGRGRQAML